MSRLSYSLKCCLVLDTKI